MDYFAAVRESKAILQVLTRKELSAGYELGKAGLRSIDVI